MLLMANQTCVVEKRVPTLSINEVNCNLITMFTAFRSYKCT